MLDFRKVNFNINKSVSDRDDRCLTHSAESGCPRPIILNGAKALESDDAILTEKILETATALIEFIPIICEDMERTIKRMVNI